ncbi:MAG: cytochrome C, partial [Variovorax sp.]
DASASVRLAIKIRAGSVGAWGRVIMPQQTQVTEAEARLLAEWVLAQHAEPKR